MNDQDQEVKEEKKKGPRFSILCQFEKQKTLLIEKEEAQDKDKKRNKINKITASPYIYAHKNVNEFLSNTHKKAAREAQKSV